MKRNNFAALSLALLLCSCGSHNEGGAETSIASSETFSAVSESTFVSETADTQLSMPAESETSAESSETTRTFSEVSEISEASERLTENSDTETETAPPVTETEPPVSEIITETEYSELLSSETSESFPTETEPALTTLSAVVSEKPANVVVPKIKTGSFTGEKILQNDLAAADITSACDGVIMVSYKGECKKVKVRITKGDTVYDYDLDSKGTVFPLQSGSGTYNIKVLENVSGKTYAIALDMDFEASIKDGLSPFLLPSQYINYSQSDKCVYKAVELCSGKTGTIDKAAAMFEYVTSHITYDKELAANVKSGYIPDPDATLESGKGICFDYASLFASMCRSQGIPAKLVMGYVRGDVYHAWNEIYTEETGWITVDLFLDKGGWELLDPTFYASASDKAQVSEYIGEGSDYSAVYYY
ncbi:MAG: transglutaminase-like domain-containing protein [Oscillospiraceae bacterium]|nr:transglutaminase-like domain-containing protein [Oscillospiraceae bacterium]